MDTNAIMFVSAEWKNLIFGSENDLLYAWHYVSDYMICNLVYSKN